MSLDDDRALAVQRLFDAVSGHDAPAWEPALSALCDDPTLVAETLQLLRTRTALPGGPLRVADAAPAAPATGPRPGDQLGPWRLGRLLGSGGMGTVFLAERADALYRREVAIKVLRGRHDPALGARLLEESQLLAGLQHPDIARLYDVGLDADGHPYLVMEYVDGLPLDAACRAHRLDLRRRLQLFVTVCRAVQAAHAQLVVHCDLKPGNILVRADLQPMLLDFGVARLLDRDGGQHPGLGFTPAYAGPEVLRGQAAGVASDVFGLGVLLTELLADRPLRRGLDDLDAPVPTPSAAAGPALPWRRDLAGDLDAIAARACAATPAARYASVEALADDVVRWLAHRPVRAHPGGRLHRARLLLRRRWRESIAAGIGVTLATGFVLSLQQARREAEDHAAAATSTAEFLIAAFDAADPAVRGGSPLGAHEILDLGARRLQAEHSGSPQLRARLQTALGRAYQNLGRPNDAAPLLESAAAQLTEAPADARDRIAVATARAQLLAGTQQHRQALDQADAALRLLDAAPDPLARAAALNARGQALAGLARYDEAQAAYEAAITQARVGDTPEMLRHRLRAMVDLGAMYRTRGWLGASETILRQALDTAGRQPQGETGLDYQRSMQALSRTLFSLGRIEEALALARRGPELTRALFGEDSSHTASAEAHLAGQYLDLGRYDDSERHFRNSREISLRTDGGDSIAYASRLYGSGVLEDARGDAVRAEQRYREALAIYRQRLGERHQDSLELEMVLARLLLRIQRLDEARNILRRVAAAWRETLPMDAPDLLSLQLIEIEWLTRAGRHAEAATALQAFAAAHPQLPSWLALRLQMQQALLAQRTRAEDAVERWRATVQTFSTLYGADSTATAKWRVPLAETLLDAGDREAARAEIARACRQLAQLSPASEFLVRIRALEPALGRFACGPQAHSTT